MFNQRNINTTHKAMDVLLRLNPGRDENRVLFDLIEASYYQRELVAAFILVNTLFFEQKKNKT